MSKKKDFFHTANTASEIDPRKRVLWIFFSQHLRNILNKTKRKHTLCSVSLRLSFSSSSSPPPPLSSSPLLCLFSLSRPEEGRMSLLTCMLTEVLQQMYLPLAAAVSIARIWARATSLVHSRQQKAKNKINRQQNTAEQQHQKEKKEKRN